MITLFEKQIIDYFTNKRLAKVLVAFSGGSDSTALLDCLVRHQEMFSFSILACHINHGIRGKDANMDAEFCKTYCFDNNIEFHLKQVNVPAYADAYGESIEAAARKLRYQELFTIAEESNIDSIVTAHHLDDRAETFFIKLFQGGSILNSAGFSYKPDQLLRPLLGIRKISIKEYLKKYSLRHVEDKTNSSFDYLRNWIRHTILKQINKRNEYFINNIINFQNEAEDFRNYIEQKTSLVLIDSDDLISSKVIKNDFISLHIVEQKFILSKLLSCRFRLEKKHLDEVLKIIHSKNSKRISLPDSTIIEISYKYIRCFNSLMIKNFKFHCTNEQELFINHLNKKVLINGFSAKDILIVRNRKNGDRFKNKKLKDIFIDKKTELFIRDTSIVLENNGEIVWVENISKNNENIKVYN